MSAASPTPEGPGDVPVLANAPPPGPVDARRAWIAFEDGALILRGPGRLGAYAALGGLALFAGAQLLAPLVTALGPIGLLLLAAAGFLWLNGRLPALRALPHELLARAQFEQAHAHARRAGSTVALRDHLASELAVPVVELRAPLAELYERLSQLERQAADERNVHLDADFRHALTEHVNEAMAALWITCRRLGVVAAQGLDFGLDHPGVRGVSRQITHLLAATRDVQRALGELSLGQGERRVEEAGVAMRVVRRQADALRRLDDLA